MRVGEYQLAKIRDTFMPLEIQPEKARHLDSSDKKSYLALTTRFRDRSKPDLSPILAVSRGILQPLRDPVQLMQLTVSDEDCPATPKLPEPRSCARGTLDPWKSRLIAKAGPDLKTAKSGESSLTVASFNAQHANNRRLERMSGPIVTEI